jgi:hypothetical protein
LLDFVSGVLSDGRRARFLRIIADFSQECLASVLDTSIPGIRGERKLIAEVRGFTCRVASDKGRKLKLNPEQSKLINADFEGSRSEGVADPTEFLTLSKRFRAWACSHQSA